MRPFTRILDRLLTLVTGLILLGGGGWLLAYRLDESHVVSATNRLLPAEIAAAPDRPWWPTVVAAAGIVIVLIALWLLLRHLTSNAAKTVATANGGSIELSKVAAAVADDLAGNPLIERARARTLVDKGQPLIRVTVTVPKQAPIAELTVLARSAQREVTAATNPNVGLQVLVNAEDT